MKCDSCGALRCLFSDHAIGSKKGPSKKQLEDLEATLENGCVCGNGLENDYGGFYAKRSLRCGEYVESQHYNSASGVKGGRIVAKDIIVETTIVLATLSTIFFGE